MLERESITYETALEARAKISPNQTFGPAYYDPIKLTATRESGTSHMAIVDKDGMSISLTTTVNLYFGAQISECT
jgi:gamma-glutamyltranspeptidase/glutathione hydrolase